MHTKCLGMLQATPAPGTTVPAGAAPASAVPAGAVPASAVPSATSASAPTYSNATMVPVVTSVAKFSDYATVAAFDPTAQARVSFQILSVGQLQVALVQLLGTIA